MTTIPERPRDAHGATVYQTFTRPGDDALLIGELDSTYLSANNKIPQLREGERLVISTPNADYLPHVKLGNQVISMCMDGRWGAEDWGQWPQWYFDGQEHYPYILRKPNQKEFKSHPLRRLWWNISQSDFQRDSSSNTFGMLLPSITEEFHELRTGLMKEVEVCDCSDPSDYQKLHRCAAKMRHCISTLCHTPQPFTGVHLTVVAAQRYCLELRAILDRIAICNKKIPSLASLPIASQDSPPHSPPSVDHARLGCITDRVPVLCELHENGIPVWYVRPSSEVSLHTTIVMQAPVTRPIHLGIEVKRWPGAPIFYQGPLSRQIHAGIENWKPGNLQLNLLGQGSLVESAAEALPERPAKRGNRFQPYPKEITATQTHLKRPNISVNYDLFKDLDFPYYPKLLNSWSKALTEVRIDTMRVIDHRDAKLFRGFAFPPRGIFSGNDEQSRLEHMLGWLVVRSSWMSTVSDARRTAPLPQRTAMAYLLAWSSLKTGAPASRQSSSDIGSLHFYCKCFALNPPRGQVEGSGQGNFPPSPDKKEDLQVLVWNNHNVWCRDSGANFRDIDQRLLIWDTEEHNFRAELSTLDHLIMGSVWDTDAGSKVRSQKIDAMWPDGGVASLSLPSQSMGVAEEDWVKRAPYVEAFQKILMDWPGDTPRLLAQLSFSSIVNGQNHWDRHTMERVEQLATGHYCQAFFDRFGRAPCPPRILPF